MRTRSTLTFSPGAAGRVLAALELDAAEHWTDRSRCGEVDPDLFFDESPEGIELAKWACSRCPVKADCLDWATSEGIEFGVYGEATPDERGVPARPTGDVVDEVLRIGGKRCSGCKAIKPLAEFHSKGTDDLHAACKVCKNARSVASHRATREVAA
jgi:WhiB family transcriptional regulator, redox-sensing transcriptional regulator